MRIDNEIALDFCDVLLKPKRSTLNSRKDVDLHRSFKFLYAEHTWQGVPIISANMTSVTTPEVAEIMVKHDMLSCIPKYKEISYTGAENLIPSIGLQPLKAVNHKFQWLALDVPNGYLQSVVDQTKAMREAFPKMILVVGNIVSAEQTEALILAGADIVKVGIGSGAACSTRIKTGVGMPQLSAVIECADAAHGLGGHIISDGGCVVAGDVVKAFAGGADFVMLGGMLAGHDENSEPCSLCGGTGRIYPEPATPCPGCNGSGKVGAFYGMSSKRGNEELSGPCATCNGHGKHYVENSISPVVVDCRSCSGSGKAGLKDYRASEGLELKLSDRGPIDATLQDIEGGLRSACSFVGAKSIKELSKRATFIRVNRTANTSLWDFRT